MFSYTFRLRRSVIVTTLLVVAVAVFTIMLLPSSGEVAVATMTNLKPPRCSTSDERVAWLGELGWQVEGEPCSELSVVIPSSFDELYSQYAVMQRQSGFRLDRHKGKTADKYCYLVTNYGDGDETAVISILQRGDRIIAADLSSARLGGFLKPLLPRSETKMH